MTVAGLRRLVVAAATVLLMAGCTSHNTGKDSGPLPTKAGDDLVCGFVSKDSGSIALGTTEFSVGGSVQNLVGSHKNADGSRLNLAGCSFSTDAEREALTIAVSQLGASPANDSQVVAALAAGESTFVFPAAEGQGYGQAGEEGREAAVAQLIRGDWRYFVQITPRVEGRDAVADAVALLRQVVNQLGLPRSEHLPRPASTPTR
ncbi:hypothetical protein [Streptomyces sp. SID13031]|uniref:hypothetical protein n=1 Tax=Streptomyces sp. SID13031 TaxID=2706046 RepID=UPI0013CC1C3D|nr:hypothetical protein [Streptomyces sp. SID13031]NEA31523.1 hypothetical protein [Streptomyces sp. SID13031]